MSVKNFFSKRNWSVVTPVYTGLTLRDIKRDFALWHQKVDLEDDQVQIHASQDDNGRFWHLCRRLSKLNLVWQPYDRKLHKCPTQDREKIVSHILISECPPTTTHSYTDINWQSPKWINNFMYEKFHFVFLLVFTIIKWHN